MTTVSDPSRWTCHRLAEQVRLCKLKRQRLLWLCAIVTALGCGDDGERVQRAPVAVVSAFPAELAPILEQTQVVETAHVGRRIFRRGKIGNTDVVLFLTGIGMVNAAEAMQALLAHFAVRGVVLSGVAGSSERIGDVVVPSVWKLANGLEFPVDAAWQMLAARLGGSLVSTFARCTEIPDRPSAPQVCLQHTPALVVGGVGATSDPFGGQAAPCREDGGDVFGCDVGAIPMRTTRAVVPVPAVAQTQERTVWVEDMETAVVAEAAAAARLPFIAFRAVSDGAGDPLGLPGFPAQFFVYYRLAARNAAAATIAFVKQLQ